MKIKHRLKQLKQLKDKVDMVILLNMDEPYKDPNFYYFTGTDVSYSIFLYDFSKPKIITNELEASKIQHETHIKNIIISKNYSKTIKKELKGRVGITEKFPHIWAKKLKVKFVDIIQDLESIRATKSKEEIKNIQNACRTSDKIFEKLHGFIKPNISEKQIIQLIKTETIKNECNIPGLEPVVNSGRKTSIPHNTEPNRRISKNDVIMIDISCIYNKYYSDCTRMFFTGKINKKIKQQYEMLKNILKQVEDTIQPGIKASEIDKFVRKKLGNLSKNFIHAAGHGLGLMLHETPHISEKSKDVLRENMVLAIEPATYFKNYGLRIENTYLLTKKGIKNLIKW